MSYIRTAINNFSDRNHEDLITLDTHLVEWSRLINDSIVSFSSGFNNWQSINSNQRKQISDINHTDLAQLHDDLTKYDGTAGGLVSSNEQFKSEMDSFRDNTNTSAQYDKIGDDIFTFDTNFFSSLASTVTFFSSVVTSLFTAFGDFAVPLQLFLVMVFISMVLGIISRSGKGGDG